MAHKIEAAPTGRASCRGCKRGIEKGELRFGEEFKNPYSEDDALSFRYWHLACAAQKLANELASALAGYDGPVPDREALETAIRAHLRPEMPYAERASTGRARCRGCDETIKKGELRVAFERVVESPMGPQKTAAYAHPRCVSRLLARDAQQGKETVALEELVPLVLAHSALSPEDAASVGREIAGS